MAINIHCQNSDCKYYWEDSCTRNLDNKMTTISRRGYCADFEEGVSEFYQLEEEHNKETKNGFLSLD